MKKTTKKEQLMPSLVLGAICLIVAVLLSVLNFVTAPRIAEETLRRQEMSLVAVFPADRFPSASFDMNQPVAVTLTGTAAETVKGVYREQNGYGYAVLLSTKTSYTSAGASMNITVAISPDGQILGATLTSYQESKNFGKDTYPDQYVGRDITNVAETPLVSGTTYSSEAFRAALVDALTTLSQNDLIGGGAP